MHWVQRFRLPFNSSVLLSPDFHFHHCKLSAWEYAEVVWRQLYQWICRCVLIGIKAAVHIHMHLFSFPKHTYKYWRYLLRSRDVINPIKKLSDSLMEFTMRPFVSLSHSERARRELKTHALIPISQKEHWWFKSNKGAL